MYAEIFRVIDEFGLEPTYDDDAAVNWVSWGDSQWVSYDDGNSMQVKLSRANALVSIRQSSGGILLC